MTDQHVLSVIGWAAGGVSASVVGLVMLAQDVLPIAGDNVPTTVTAALAAAMSSMALIVGWVVRKFVLIIQSGEWVRQDAAEQAKLLARTMTALEHAEEREKRMTQWLFDREFDRRKEPPT